MRHTISNTSLPAPSGFSTILRTSLRTILCSQVMDAKVDDLSDRLRIGMASLQSALGEANSRGGTGSGPTLSIDEVGCSHGVDEKGHRKAV